jgi:FkbM family methyltransferase
LFNEIFVDARYLFISDNPRPIILDCGSNIGLSILFFKLLYPHARIIGFEPDPPTFEALTSNIGRNSLSNVVVHPYALGDRDENILFYRNTNQDRSELTMSTLKRRNSGREITVQCRKLSAFIIEEIDLLKLDVEGVEHSVLQELSASGKLHKIKQIQLEYHHHIDVGSDVLSATLGLLEREGFGYQIQTSPTRQPAPHFQDISIYCYRKDDTLISAPTPPINTSTMVHRGD